MQVFVPSDVEEAISRLPRHFIPRIRAAILALPRTWKFGKKLDGAFSAYRAIRVHPYRILYRIDNSRLLIFVIRVADRKDAYR
jgi:mRNA-degrading endonuclease RelE of RelBE toxin-antitoxin system